MAEIMAVVGFEEMREALFQQFAMWICIAFAAACGSHSLLSFTVSPQSAILKVGEKLQFTATGVFNSDPSPAPIDDVSWHSTNSRVVPISPSGLATCLSEGSVTITASAPTSPGPPLSLPVTLICE